MGRSMPALLICLLPGLLAMITGPPAPALAAPAWEARLAGAEALAASGDADSAALLLSETLAEVLTEYSESDTTLEVELCRGGIRRPFHFTSLEEAESLYVRALRLKESLIEEPDAELARILSDLAFVYLAERKQPEVWDTFERALSVQEEVLGPNHVDTAMSVGALATYHAAITREHAYAESLFMRTFAIQEKAFGPDHRALTEFLWSYGHMLMMLGRFDEAVVVQRRDLDIKTRVYGPESAKVAGTLSNMSYALMYLGEYAEAESLRLRQLAIYEAVNGPGSYGASLALDGLGMIYNDTGRYAEAEPVLRRSLGIKEDLYGRGSQQYASTCHTLGNTCIEQARYAEAERFYRSCKDVYEEQDLLTHYNYGIVLYSLAEVHKCLGEYAEAEPLLEKSVEVWEQVYGPYHFNVGGGLRKLAFVCSALGRYAEAESLFHRAMAIADSSFGPENWDRGNCWMGLADIRIDQGLYAEAEAYLRDAIANREDDPGAGSEFLPKALGSMMRLHRLRGESSEALDKAEQALSLRRESFLANSHALSEKDAIAYSGFLRAAVDDYLTCFADMKVRDDALTARTGDILFSSKGQVSDGIFERQRNLVDESDAAVLDLAEELRITKLHLSRAFVEGPEDDIVLYRTEIDSLQRTINVLEAELSRLSASYQRNREAKEVGTAWIAASLPERSTLVEFVRYNYSDLESGRSIPRYLAVVLAPYGLRAIEDLGEARALDDRIKQWKDHMVRVASSGRLPTVVDLQEHDGMSAGLYRSIWAPLEAYTEDSDAVLLAPDGALSLLAFAALRTPGGEYLIEKHTLHYLSAGRDLVRLGYEPWPASGLFALGDPDYGAIATERVAAVETPGDHIVEVAMVTRNLRSGCGELNEIEVPPLPGTRREVELVSEGWERYTGEPLIACYGDEASEEYFNAEAPGKRAIHLATHGYYLGGSCRGEDAGADYVGENPLLLSGLFLAGANLHGEGADSLGAEDGILTAYEVTEMDLEGTEIVVLSACETGLGEVTEGEGVYGLRRAFQMAGARTVVSALWPVSDEATADMMGNLYARDDESLPAAMRRVQLEKIRKQRSEGGIDHPFIWGAFIALGDWR